jgi:hypothetical protein
MRQNGRVSVSNQRRSISDRAKGSHTRHRRPSRSSLLRRSEQTVWTIMRRMWVLVLLVCLTSSCHRACSGAREEEREREKEEEKRKSCVTRNETGPFTASMFQSRGHVKLRLLHPTKPNGRIYLPFKSCLCGGWESPWPSISFGRLSTMA